MRTFLWPRLHALRGRGLDCVHAREVGLRSAPDEAILEWAASEDRACVTLDHDLARILAQSNAQKPSVILLRAAQLGEEEVTAFIIRILNRIGGEITEGIAATATPQGIRVRRLPLGLRGG